MQAISSVQINQIIILRKTGLSINEISQELKISKSTVQRYVKSVALSRKAQILLKQKRGYNTRRKQERIKYAEQLAEREISSLDRKEKLLLLSALYWAEGSKGDFSITNSDPDMIYLFSKGVQEILGISSSSLQLSLRIFEDMDADTCCKFWLKVTGLLPENILSVHILKGKKRGKLKYGMCRLRIRKGSDYLKLLTAIRNQIVRSISPKPL